MSSIKSSFNYDELDYEPTIDSKFVDNLYKLILSGDTSKVIKHVKSLLNETPEINFNDNSTFVASLLDHSCSGDDYDAEGLYEGDGGEAAYEDIPESTYDNNKYTALTFSNEFTPLMLAAQMGLYELVEFFIESNFPVKKTIKKTGLTALLAACCSRLENDHSESHFENITKCVKILIENGADTTDILFKTNHSALHLAAAANNVPTSKYLVDLIDVNCRNSKGCTPLMIAASKGYIEIVKVLLEAGSDIMLRNLKGLAAVDLAIINNREEIVKLLICPTNITDFYHAWSLVNQNIVECEKVQNIEESLVKKFYSSKYFSDPVACMCASLYLTHLQPIFEKHGVTFAKLRSMSDDEMKKIGISKFSDRKCILNLMQEVHKVTWNHRTSLYTPNYKLSITPLDMLDVIRNANEHLEFLESTIGYIANHMETNPTYYLEFSQNKSFFEKCVSHCQFTICKTKSIYDNVMKVDSIFDKMYEYALDEDLPCQLDDEAELRKQLQLAKKYKSRIKTGIVISGISIIAVLVIRSRIINA